MDLGLNDFLQPINAPVSEEIAGAVSAFDVTSNFARNSITQSKIPFLPVDKIGAGTIIVSFNLGSTSGGYLLLDGGNNRILVNDGTTNRIVIGSV